MNLLEKNLGIKEIVDYLENQGYSFIGAGGTRWVYLSSDKEHVIKIPKPVDGGYANNCEYERYKKFGKFGDFPIAECEFINICGWDVLKMEYVKPIERPYSLNLHWVDFIDCAQVGYDKNNQVVAYDYA